MPKRIENLNVLHEWVTILKIFTDIIHRYTALDMQC